MAKISFTVYGRPQGKARAKVTVRGGWAHAYTPENTVMYENYIKMCFKQASNNFFSSKPLILRVVAFYPIPKSFSRKNHEQAISGKLRPCVKPDHDNVIKVVGDALNSLAYSDDKIIVESSFKKFYGEVPRVEIEIEEVMDEGGVKDIPACS